MGEVAVEAHRDANASDAVERHREDDVVPAEAPAPGQRYRCDQREHRNRDEDPDQHLLEGALRFILKIT
jgi:hypothetical protein